MEQPVSRKKIYLVILCLDIMTSIERVFVFPNQDWIFYVSLFFGTFFMIALVWECLLLQNRIFEKKLPVAVKPVLRIILQVLITTLCANVFGFVLFGAAEKIFHVVTPDMLTKIMPALYFLASLVLNLTYFGVYYFTQWRENLLRAERLQREQAEVRYDALRNQLNPHFLFNALTSLNTLIFENQQLASDFLHQLSKVYRYTLQHKNKETVLLKIELDLIKSYISLFKIRFENAIIFSIDIADVSKEKGIPPVTLQMLIENAAKHNIIEDANPLTISITSTEDHIIVQNNLNRKSQVESSNKHGLENLKALYKYLSEKPVEVIETETTFAVKIPLV